MSDVEEYIYFSKINYEHHLKSFIEDNYVLKIGFMSVMNWGYTTTAYYFESDKGNFVARISPDSPDKAKGLKNDILVSNILKDDFPIPGYYQANSGAYLLKYIDYDKTQRLLRVSDLVQGVLSFDIKPQILGEMTEFLKRLHWEIPQHKMELLKTALNAKSGHFLHGDLTPTNTLVNHHKIVRIVDFEHCKFGQIEDDLARTAIFAWFHLNSADFEEIVEIIKKSYQHDFDKKTFINFATYHLNTHMENIQKHEEQYIEQEKFDQDVQFAQKMFNSFSSYLKAKGLSRVNFKSNLTAFSAFAN